MVMNISTSLSDYNRATPQLFCTLYYVIQCDVVALKGGRASAGYEGQYSFDIVFITESWLNSNIPDDIIRIEDCRVFRRDREGKGRGGICIYVKNNHTINIHSDIPNEHECEVLWAMDILRRLPRRFSKLVVAVLYHPPSANKTIMLNYLQSSLQLLETKYPNCGLILAGVFNKLLIQNFARHFQLKQIVNFPTRGTNTLDLILTNLTGFYDKPYSAPPLGLSDHLSVFVLPIVWIEEKQCKEMIYVRDKRPSSVRCLGRFLCEVPWDLIFTAKLSCEQNLSNFANVIDYGLNTLMPLRAAKVHGNDKPWMNKNLKILIRRRQKAFAQNYRTLYKKLRNKINRTRKKCRKMYYEAKVKELKFV